MGHIHEEHAYDDNGHRQDDGPGCAEFQCAEFLVVGLFRLFSVLPSWFINKSYPAACKASEEQFVGSYSTVAVAEA